RPLKPRLVRPRRGRRPRLPIASASPCRPASRPAPCPFRSPSKRSRSRRRTVRNAIGCAGMAERVLITGARAAVAVDLARDFRRAGWEVHLADSTTARIARWSRAPHAVHRYGPPRAEPERFAADIAALDATLI